MIKILLTLLALGACAYAAFVLLKGRSARLPLSPMKLAYGAAGLLLLVAAGAWWWNKSHPDAERNGAIWGDAGLPGSATAAAASGGAPQLDDVDTMITRLAARLEKDGSDGEGWRMLGWSYFNTGKMADAARAYGRAAAILNDRADILGAYGEAVVAAAGDKVTAEARAQFDKALALDKQEPRARFYIALQRAQEGHEREALDTWIGIANETPRDQMWAAGIRKRIFQLGDKLGIDVAKRLKPLPTEGTISADTMQPPQSPPVLQGIGSGGPTATDIAAADKMAPGDRNAMIQGMVDGLAQKLANNPGDADGWIKLLRSRVVLGQVDKAKSEYDLARKALAKDANGLARVDATARNIGIAGR